MSRKPFALAFSNDSRSHIYLRDKSHSSITQLNSFAGSLGDSIMSVALEPAGLVELAGTTGIDPLLLVGSATLAVLALGASTLAISSSKNNEGQVKKVTEAPEPEPEPIDVSIPYDATVIQAYTEWRKEEPDLKSECYAQYKQLYLEKTVAEVAMKEKSRRLQRFEEKIASSS